MPSDAVARPNAHECTRSGRHPAGFPSLEANTHIRRLWRCCAGERDRRRKLAGTAAATVVRSESNHGASPCQSLFPADRSSRRRAGRNHAAEGPRESSWRTCCTLRSGATALASGMPVRATTRYGVVVRGQGHTNDFQRAHLGLRQRQQAGSPKTAGGPENARTAAPNGSRDRTSTPAKPASTTTTTRTGSSSTTTRKTTIRSYRDGLASVSTSRRRRPSWPSPW